MSNFTRIEKIVILIIVTIITITVGYKVFGNNDKEDIKIEDNILLPEEKNEGENEIFTDKSSEQVKKTESNEETKEQDDELQTHVVVHITGEVSSPGVVKLENGSRVVDAIKKAGGLLPLADESNINLAQKLFDEDKIMIPRMGETLELEPSNTEVQDNGQSNVKNSVQKETQEVVTSKNNDNTNSSTNTNSGGGVNINNASQEELKTLPGIGDVTAQKIIDYRESTKFESTEDIKNVSGIGEKKFEAIQSMITTR